MTIPSNGYIFNEGQEGYWALDGVNSRLQFPNLARIGYGLDESLPTEDDLKIFAGNTGSVYISANGEDWKFGNDGVLTFPSGNLSIGNALGSDSIVGNTDASVGVLAQGQYGTIGLQWIDNLSNIGSTSTQTQVAGVVVNNPLASTTGTVQIVTGFVSTATTATSVEHTWTFGTDGGLTFPDNTVQTTAFTATSYISKSELQSVVAASTDFADFQSRIAAL
jgi:hypothetical protein